VEDENLVVWENSTGNRLGHTITYNIGGKLAKNEIFSILHADMFIGPNYVENALKHIQRGTVVSATRIEPPLHPEGLEKIVKDFGMWPESFMEREFLSFVAEEQLRRKDEITHGIFAPWFIHKEDFLDIGGHDSLFAPFPYEDSDIFQRFVLAGYKLVQSRDALVYHLTCRGHKWTDNNELGKVDTTFIVAERNARINYLRKWNSWIQNDEYHYPIIPPKYNTTAVLKNLTNIHQLETLEPWFGRVIVDVSSEPLRQEYITIHQPNTSINLAERIGTKLPSLTNDDIRVIIDCNRLTNEDMSIVTKLSYILHNLESSDTPNGTYEVGNLTIEVNKLENIVSTLIKC
jgi:hypothetical protein